MWASVYDFFRDEGSIVAGLLALGAAYLTIRATRQTADRTIQVMRETTDREIAAAQEQTSVAQKQIATTLTVEQQRNTREAWAFYGALVAAMATVLEDATAAREIAKGMPQQQNSAEAYAARQRISKSLFPELRVAMLRLGGQFTAPFVTLDDRITRFSGRWVTAHGSGGEYRVGSCKDLIEELAQIELEAKSLSDEAGAAIKLCLDELAKLSD